MNRFEIEIGRRRAPLRFYEQFLRSGERTRTSAEHLTVGEIEALIEAARGKRYGNRDATMILLAFRHGLRASEVCDLRRGQVDFNGAVLHVRTAPRAPTPIQGDELRGCAGSFAKARRHSIFVSERGSPFTTAGFARMTAPGSTRLAPNRFKDFWRD